MVLHRYLLIRNLCHSVKYLLREKSMQKQPVIFSRRLCVLNAEDSNRTIDILINTPGGCINSGMLIYDVIQASKAPVRTFCIGRAYSMGAVLLSCGNHGRYILPHGEVMIHEPLLGDRVGGNSSSIKSISESLLETKHKMNMIPIT